LRFFRYDRDGAIERERDRERERQRKRETERVRERQGRERVRLGAMGNVAPACGKKTAHGLKLDHLREHECLPKVEGVSDARQRLRDARHAMHEFAKLTHGMAKEVERMSVPSDADGVRLLLWDLVAPAVRTHKDLDRLLFQLDAAEKRDLKPLLATFCEATNRHAYAVAIQDKLQLEKQATELAEFKAREKENRKVMVSTGLDIIRVANGLADTYEDQLNEACAKHLREGDLAATLSSIADKSKTYKTLAVPIPPEVLEEAGERLIPVTGSGGEQAAKESMPAAAGQERAQEQQERGEASLTTPPPPPMKKGSFSGDTSSSVGVAGAQAVA